MYIVAIARIVTGEQLYDTSKIRILDIVTKNIKDIDFEELSSMIYNEGVKIHNIDYEGKTSRGINGSIERLPRVLDGHLMEDDYPLTILLKVGKRAFMVSDYSGAINIIREHVLIEYSVKNRIINALVSNKADTTYIKGVYSEFKEIESSSELEEHFDIEDKEIDKANAKLKLTNSGFMVTASLGIKLLKENIERIVIPNIVTHLDGVTFEDNKHLKSIVLSNRITYIPDKTFRFCINLEDIEIPESVTGIGTEVFYGCDKLKGLPERFR